MATKAPIAEVLDQIPEEERPALLARWHKAHGAPPPKNLSVAFLRLALSYEVQCARQGGSSARVLRDLKRLTVPARPGAVARPGLKPGDQLLREWNGHTYRVTVSDAGFEMDGRVWTSLSGVARHITGAHWSGPRFFGLIARSSRRDEVKL